MDPSRRAVLAAGVASLSGCLGILGGGSSGPSSDDPTTTPEDCLFTGDSPAGSPPTADEALPVAHGYPELRDAVVYGGTSKDGIPSIDDPTFVDVGTAHEHLGDGDPVFGIASGCTPRAYPQNVLVRHRIVNDEIDGRPVAVTYAPLTGTAMGFERGDTAFGVTGRLLNDNLMMYDRATDSRWPQILGTAIDGDHEGESLREFRVIWTTWERWRRLYPETEVLSRTTGYDMDYDEDPYGDYDPPTGYYSSRRLYFDPMYRDDRLHPKTVIVGARTADGVLAVPKSALREREVVEVTLDGTPYLVVYDVALDAGYVYRNPDGAAFEAASGREIEGPEGTHAPDDLPLERVVATDAMWFAWVAFYPDLTLSDPD